MTSFLESLFNQPKAINVAHERRNISNLALGIGAILFFNRLFQVIVLVLLNILFPTHTFSYSSLLLISSVILYGVAMPLSMVFFRECDVHRVEKRKMDAGLLISVIILCFGLLFAGSILGAWVDDLVLNLMGGSTGDPLGDTVSSISLWSIFLHVVVLAPIFEEIFYRRVVIDRLRRYGDGTAIVISGLVFGMIHGNFRQFFYATFLGMVFAAIYLHTGKLRITVFLHMLLNFVGTFYVSMIAETFGGEIPLEFTAEVIQAYPVGYAMLNAYILLYYGSMVLAIPALIFLIREVRLMPGEISLKGSDRTKAVFCNLGFWYAAITLVGSFATNFILS